MCYGEDVGLIPLRFKKGFEAISPMHQHPHAPHPNPCLQLRSSTFGRKESHTNPTVSLPPLCSSGRQAADANRFCLCCHLPRETSIPAPARRRGHVLRPGLQPALEVPRGARTFHAAHSLRRHDSGPGVTIPAAPPPLLFTRLKKKWEIETAYSNHDKNAYSGKSPALT